MQMNIIINSAGETPRYTLVIQQAGNIIRLACRSRDDAYQLGASIAGAIDVHTKIEVEYL